MEFKDTETYKNLKFALSCEAEAIVRYQIYAASARKQGQESAALLFEKMARNELEHAKVWFKELYPENTARNIEESVKEVATLENHEWKELYPSFSDIARKEGLKNIADMFTRISAIECEHERRFIEFHLSLLNEKEENLAKLENVAEEKEEKNITRYCMFCGYPSELELEICPVCGAKDSIRE